MIRTTELEKAAMAAALRPLGDFVAARGLHTPLANYPKDDVLALIQTVVTAYHDHLRNAAALQLHSDRRQLHPPEEPFIDDELPF